MKNSFPYFDVVATDMKKNIVARILLSPFALLYGGIISLRNIFYEAGLLKSTSFNVPIINVGNLSIGGTGKTPHIEYLIKVLSPYIDVGTLSRGYKRRSKGFRLVSQKDDAAVAGDEPLQFKRKFPHIPVAVSESRNIGIPLMLKQHPNLQSILLDDAFQHRSVIPGLNILLTQFNEPFFEDYLMPLGTLREPRESYERADIIVVTKCPDELPDDEKEGYLSFLKPFPNQKVFFSRYKYQDPYFMFNPGTRIKLDKHSHLILISAIAKVDYLTDYLDGITNVDNIVKFEDHHYFSDLELEQFKKIYDNIGEENAFFLTTEKDAMRLDLHRDFLMKNQIPVFVLPIEVEIIDEPQAFEDAIKSFLIDFKV